MASRTRVRNKTLNHASAKRRKSTRAKRRKKRKLSFFGRVLRLIFNPFTFAISALLVLGFFLVGAYFWFKFSAKVDLLLSGEIFTRNAGIYSAPKTIRKGDKITLDELIGYLKSAGYVNKTQKADFLRSRYETGVNLIKIEPGNSSIIDGKRNYRDLEIKFGRGGRFVASIVDSGSNRELKKTLLEPQLLSSIAAEGNGRRKVVTINDLPPHLIKAITVTEDRSFFEHYGINFRGIARALWFRYKGKADSPIANQGGSSITQQLVKNLLLSPEKSYERKIKEAYMALILETRLTKKEIFTLYVNQIYLGQNAGMAIYGVGEAANIYFGKDVSALTLSESAFIAGIIRSPNRYNPYKNLKSVEKRRNQVIDSMLEAKAITRTQAQMAKSVELKLNKFATRIQLQGMQYFSRYTVEHVLKEVNDPESLQHLRVYTTIDPDLQKVAHKVVTRRLAKLEKLYKKGKQKKLNAALVAIKPKTGEIVAMIGGRNYLDNQFNRATDAKRQPGSIFKPFVYTSAINTAYRHHWRTLTAASIFKDEKKIFTFSRDSYSPNNYGDFFSNKELTLRDALIKSKNVITVDLAMELHIGNVMNLAHRAGLPKVRQAYPSMALGTSEATPLQIATAYTTFANLGHRVSPVAINRVATGDGKTIIVPKSEKKEVLRSDVAYIMNDMMKDVINKGTAARAKAWGFINVSGKRGYAGKTGTSRDGWFVGFTPKLVCVVYVGFDDGSDLGLEGSKSAMPMWAEFMRAALKRNPEWNGDWMKPDTIVHAEIDIRNGNLLRELSDDEVKSIKAQNGVLEKKSVNEVDKEEKETYETDVEYMEKLRSLYIAGVPEKFRRIELFISGTLPDKFILPDEFTKEPSIESGLHTTLFKTWQDAQEEQEERLKSFVFEGRARKSMDSKPLVYCLISGKLANSTCPDVELKIVEKSADPKEFCQTHVDHRKKLQPSSNKKLEK